MAGDVLSTFRGVHDHGRCTDDALATAEALCAEKGLRLTALRRRVLELVWSRHQPVRAYDLLEDLRAERRRAAPPTVYRALDFLIANRLVHRIESLNAYVGCAGPRNPHVGQFLICRKCSAVAELNDGEIARTVARKARGLGFTVERQTIEIAGLCPQCGGTRAA
ncbi:MAG: transcriptional repressor [Alphaproteobacteria bacterium]|nr:transcriptional repressor [Alphaproteobacteria bacterium]